jgi:RNA-directed DNA polymerase
VKRVGFLFEQISSFENLIRAIRRAARGKKAKASVASCWIDMEKEAIALQEELMSGAYRPGPYHQFKVFEPKERNICSSAFRDRVVHHAICGVLEPYFERRLIHDSYACRTGKGSHRAIRRCQDFTRKYRYFLKCDISKYFDSVDHEVLKSLLRRFFKDSRLLALLDQIVHHSVPGATPGKGLPIGNLTSQHFANLYLGELDHWAKERLHVPGYLRYMDDFILFHDSKVKLQLALEQIISFIEVRLKLQLKEKVTTLAPVSQGVPFLGFRIFPGLIRLQRKNLIRLRRNLALKEKEFLRGKISEEDLVLSINSALAHAALADSTFLLRKEVARSLKMA